MCITIVTTDGRWIQGQKEFYSEFNIPTPEEYDETICLCNVAVEEVLDLSGIKWTNEDCPGFIDILE